MASPIGEPIRLKVIPGQCPGNAPPEMAAEVFRLRWSAKRLQEQLEECRDDRVDARQSELAQCLELVQAMERRALEDGSPPAEQATLHSAQCSYDVWGFGVMLFRLFTGSVLLRHNLDDNLDDDDELRRVVLWPGMDEDALRKKVFASAEQSDQSVVSALEKDTAVQLMAACLRGKLSDRPDSLQAVRKLPYFQDKGSAVKSKLLFVSTPGKGYNPESDRFDLNVPSVLF